MARSPEELARLAIEIAALSPEEREQVLAQARQLHFRPIPEDWEPPLLKGGNKWVGGSLRREEMYGDDER
jgi:hypothetical protein